MDNNVQHLRTKICISLATMGQDQRHRTIDRSEPRFTNNFYLPPIPRALKLEKEALEVMKKWNELAKKVPASLVALLAPYGAMVTYTKSGNLNAICHEQGKRLCWCAQEEIYNLSVQLRQQLIEAACTDEALLSIFEPPCLRGKCPEGKRYCCRNLMDKDNYFPERKI
jgi:hypothetical protein